MSDQKKLFFAEIADGEFAKDVQEEFERAQTTSEERGLPATIVVKIAVTPPKRGERWGNVGYEVETKLPKRTSPQLTADWRGNRIVADGRDMADILQEELDLGVKRGPRSLAMGEDS